MRKQLIVLAAAATALAAPLAASAQDTGNWLIRGRVLSLDSANKDSTGLGLSINNKVFPELDITYFITPNLATELVLTYTQKQDVRSNGTNIGSFKHLPPTLSLQYHVTGLNGWRPYVGAGLNYTRISSVKFAPGIVTALNPTLDKSSTGLALGVGADVQIGGGWLLNFDVKKVQIRTDVKSFGAKAGELRIDPLLVSVGIGKRF
jgi:outer membrane protein